MCMQKTIENWCYHLTGVKILETAIFYFTLLIAFDYFVLQMQKQRQVDLWRLLQSKVVLNFFFFFFKWSIKDSINFPLVRKLTRLPVLIELDETLDLGFAACPHALGYPPSIMVEFKTNWLVLFFPPWFQRRREEDRRRSMSSSYSSFSSIAASRSLLHHQHNWFKFFCVISVFLSSR